MVDADVAYLSPSSVYRVLHEADLLHRWKRSQAKESAPVKPTRPQERWHTDLMYLRIQDTWSFLVTVLDGYSRFVVHGELLTTMRAADVRLVVPKALEATGVTPAVVSDNGSQFTAAEFKDLVRRFALEHLRIRWYRPASNGLVERFHRSTREAFGDADLRNLAQARPLLGEWVQEYNETRLHAGLGYLLPTEFFRGDPAARRAERRAKLTAGRDRKRAINQARLKAAA
jgi:transposase InsO family protein